MKLIKVKLSEIKPYFRNPREISERSIELVSKSIEEYGYITPIILDGKNTIIAGHTRYYALCRLFNPNDEFEVIYADLSDKEAKAYRIIDNKISESGEWDMKKLISELKLIGIEDIQFAYDVDLNLVIGDEEDIEEVEKTEKPTKAYSELKKVEVQEKSEQDKMYDEYIAESTKTSLGTVTCIHCNKDFKYETN